MTDAYEGPLPAITDESRPFWDALRAGRLRFQKCAECGTVRHYPRPMCDRCHSMEAAWIDASGRGQIYSWTVSHHPFHPAWKAEVPYVLVTVDLEEGVRMHSRLVGDTEPAVGMPVEIGYRPVTDEVTLPFFRPAAASDSS